MSKNWGSKKKKKVHLGGSRSKAMMERQKDTMGTAGGEKGKHSKYMRERHEAELESQSRGGKRKQN